LRGHYLNLASVWSLIWLAPGAGTAWENPRTQEQETAVWFKEHSEPAMHETPAGNASVLFLGVVVDLRIQAIMTLCAISLLNQWLEALAAHLSPAVEALAVEVHKPFQQLVLNRTCT